MPRAKSGIGAGVKEGGRAAGVADATLSNADTRPGLASVLILGPRSIAAAFRGVGECERERPSEADGGPGT